MQYPNGVLIVLPGTPNTTAETLFVDGLKLVPVWSQHLVLNLFQGANTGPWTSVIV